MKYMNIGHSDVKASIITLGAWSIGGGSWWKNTEDELSIKTIHRALELGINTIDTAPIYGLGHSEEIVGKAISGNRDEFVIPRRRPSTGTPAWAVIGTTSTATRYMSITATRASKKDCENSLKRLGTDHIDIYYAHNPAKDTSVYPVEDTVRALMDLKKEGKVLALGLSNAQPDVIQDWLDHGCELDIIQRKYSMLTRNVEEGVLPLCREKGMSYHAYSPLERGILAGTVPADRVVPKGDARDGELWWSPDRLPSAVKFVDGLADICEEYQCTRVQLAVAFLRAQGDFVNVICGAHKPEQIEADAPAADVELSNETVADIRKRLAALDAEFE